MVKRNFENQYIIIARNKIASKFFFSTKEEAIEYINKTYLRPNEKQTMTLNEYLNDQI